MILAVNATRMELQNLKKRVKTAKRGHKLLKDKMDELMRNFLQLIHETRSIRENVEKELAGAYKSFIVARAVMSSDTLEEAIMSPSRLIKLKYKTVPIMNLREPEFELEAEGDVHCYGFNFTSADLDFAIETFGKVLEDLIKLAELENKVKDLAYEIETTRRRVNALEYVLIPNLEETIKYISMKLSEMERSNLSRLMRLKEIVRGH